MAGIVQRGEIHRSLGTESERRARELLPAARDAVLAELDTRMAMREPANANEAYQAAMAQAQLRGFPYKPAQEILAGPLEEILQRIESLKPGDTVETKKALLGMVETPQLMLSELVAEIEKVSAYENRYKSDNQMRLWRHPRERAVANLIAALGEDRLVTSIGNAEALKHRTWWKARIAKEGKKPDTANKDFSNMAGMLRRYYESIEVAEPPKPYAGVSLEDRHAMKARQLEISADWIVEKWFAPGALDGLNDQARDILLISIETGCRQSEICDLPASAFVLDDPIPHLRVAFEEGDDRREVKNTSSVREVPLVGVALAAAKRHPQGFPRYRGKSGYSAAINKFLRKNELLPSPKHTVGGVRHAWESRLEAAGLHMDQRGEMMGHSVEEIRGREVYGDKKPLEWRWDMAFMIMLPVPEHLA